MEDQICNDKNIASDVTVLLKEEKIWMEKSFQEQIKYEFTSFIERRSFPEW